MDAYIYQAALLCTDCADKKRGYLRDTSNNPKVLSLSEDSDHWPQGPYGNGGGEADCPQHCDQCGMFLENPLTADGEGYVSEAVYEAMHDGELNGAIVTWRDFYSYLFKG